MSTLLPRPISHTEICQRVRGIIADALVVNIGTVRDTLYLRVGLGLSWSQTQMIVAVIESAFEVHLPEAWTDEFWTSGTVGELISLVEGALKAGGIS